MRTARRGTRRIDRVPRERDPLCARCSRQAGAETAKVIRVDANEARPRVRVVDSVPGRRTAEPIEFTVPGVWGGALRYAQTDTGETIFCQRLSERSDEYSTTFATVVDVDGVLEFSLGRAVQGDVPGIVRSEGMEADAFARLNTGYFDLELCRGTGEGTGSSKWGIRHLSSLAEGRDLLPSGNNAIGGFYGPFFTPENGLINPPEHCIVDIDVIEQGPILHHYRMRGTIPNGLLPELEGKSFSIDWVFTYGTPYFQRTYTVDSFQTVINGRSVTDKITVGDEFESGKGDTVFSRFASSGGTWFREGDPYAEELKRTVEETVANRETGSDTFERFRSQLVGDLGSAHWDLYWRLFCKWEGALDEAELRRLLGTIRATSHVRADGPERGWVHEPAGGAVDVSAVADETIFAGPATKSVEFDPATGQAMIWWTSRPSGAFQIVQRPSSGWVNWGTNGENECPELPVGTLIKTAYGRFIEGWEGVADQLETRPAVSVLWPHPKPWR
jgi:hypothetical protein